MNKKPYIILITIFAVSIILVYVVSFIIENNAKYIVLPDGNHLKQSGDWTIVNNDELPNKKYKIMENGNIILETKLEILDERIMAQDKEIMSNVIAYRGKNVDNQYYEEKEFNQSDYQYLNQIINQKGINCDSHRLPFLYKYKIDLNNDSIKETIFAIANHYDTEIGQLFAMIIIKENNEIINFKIFETEMDAYLPYLYFINIDKKVSIIFKNTYASLIGQDVKIISFNNNLDYKMIFEEDAK